VGSRNVDATAGTEGAVVSRPLGSGSSARGFSVDWRTLAIVLPGRGSYPRRVLPGLGNDTTYLGVIKPGCRRPESKCSELVISTFVLIAGKFILGKSHCAASVRVLKCLYWTFSDIGVATGSHQSDWTR
jgi:hypothetical protein